MATSPFKPGQVWEFGGNHTRTVVAVEDDRITYTSSHFVNQEFKVSHQHFEDIAKHGTLQQQQPPKRGKR